MHRIANVTLAVAAGCLVIVQVTGLHMHVDLQGYVGVPETPYTHSHVRHDHHHGDHGAASGAAPDGGHVPLPERDGHHEGERDHDHDYDGAEDASLLDGVVASFKLSSVALVLVFLFALFPRVRTLASADIAYPVLSGRYTRWRPPLRAPPQTA